MINPIQITQNINQFVAESLDYRDKSTIPFSEYNEQLFSEAVFSDGKSSIKPIEEQFQKIKDRLEFLLKESGDGSSKQYDPIEFARSQEFKDLENMMRDTFGFRNVEVLNLLERYRYGSKDRDFESMTLNCWTYTNWRYPIDGLITNKGFYDKTHSINTSIQYSTGLFLKLTAQEITAIFLHEFGHNIDPALVTISYVETNAMVKYLTDRDTTKKEKDAVKIAGGKFKLLAKIFAKAPGQSTSSLIQSFTNIFKGLFFKKEKALAKLKKTISENEKDFARQTNQEAYADNFARMYGYGAALISGLSKISLDTTEYINSRISKEKKRQQIIIDIAISSIKDVHGGVSPRIASLIKEYKADLKNPEIPEKVKKDIQKDLEELEAVRDAFLNGPDEFTNMVNKIIIDEYMEDDKD